ncbi:MAG: hypothetical protein ACRELC_07015, partial [Gemmatimonadota bacterium]
VEAIRRAATGTGAPPAGEAALVGGAELGEQRELDAAMEAAIARARGPVFVLDLHTTSSDSVPFTTLGDALANRRLARRLPIPMVLGLEEQIDGALLHYLDHRRLAGIGIEGGAHESEASVDAHEDAVWLALSALGMVDAADVPDLAERHARLARSAESLPPVLEVSYRHAIAPEDEFRMRPGYRNFQPVRRGDTLGFDRHGPVSAPESGRIFLPLYQTKGDDGFFLVRPVHPVWLGISAALRRLRADRLAPLVPGVRRHAERDDALVLSPRAANRLVIGLLHLLGFTRRRERDRLVMIRRSEPGRPPAHSERSASSSASTSSARL